MRLLAAVGVAAAWIPGVLAAQSATGDPKSASTDGRAASADYVRLPEPEEIALARSAAPESVSADATIWVFRDGEFEVAVEGTNGNHCMVSRSQPPSLEPICYDPEAAASIMKWEHEYVRLRTAGTSAEERDAALERAIGGGDIPLPRRPAMTYMMSSGQHLYDPESGHDAGNWKPHLMLYVPYLTSEAIGFPETMPWIQVANAGTPMACLVVVVPDFVDPTQP